MKPSPCCRPPSGSSPSSGCAGFLFRALLRFLPLLLLLTSRVPGMGAVPLTAQQIGGVVFDEATGAPVQGASVNALDARLQAVGRVVTDATGRFGLALPDTGYYVVSASRSGYAASAPEQVWLGPGEEVTVMLALRRSVTRADSAATAEVQEVTARRAAEGARTGYLYGQVLDNDGGQPIVNADVQVDGEAGGTITNGDGRFAIRAVPPGRVRLRFQHLSYAPRQTTVEVQPGMAYEVRVRLDPDPLELAGIEVTTRSRFVARRLEPVYQRMGMGTAANFLTKRDFQTRGIPPIGQMLRGLPAVRVRNSGHWWTVHMGRAGRFGDKGCKPTVYLDGMRVALPDDNAALSEFLSMSTFDVEVIEVYKGPASLPPEFNDPGTMCAIGIWTRRGG